MAKTTSTAEYSLLMNPYIRPPMKVVLQGFFENGGIVREVFYGKNETDIFTLIEYKGTNIPLRFFGKNYFLLFNSTLSQSITTDKHITHELIKAAGLPSSPMLLYGPEIVLEDVLQQFSPVVVKPAAAAHGDGITMGITTADGLQQAIKHAQKFGEKVLLQPQIEGQDYRLLFVNYKLVGALRRHQPFVIGDGASTTEQLVEQENKRRLVNAKKDAQKSPLSQWRGEVCSLISLEEITRSRGVEFMHTVPSTHEKVILLEQANISLGGISEDVTSLVSPDVAAVCSRFLQSIGLELGGVDILSPDIAAPFDENKTCILEVNSAPGLLPHARPNIGQPQDVGKVIAEALYQKQKSLQ